MGCIGFVGEDAGSSGECEDNALACIEGDESVAYLEFHRDRGIVAQRYLHLFDVRGSMKRLRCR